MWRVCTGAFHFDLKYILHVAGNITRLLFTFASIKHQFHVLIYIQVEKTKQTITLNERENPWVIVSSAIQYLIKGISKLFVFHLQFH